tara:strand:- start:166 stop:543 length:378 start_codon:yes stop_codon:yes gene_type:complete
MRKILKNSDIFGASSSTLCLLHCLVTPLLFFVPFWWSGLNFAFILVSLFAVHFSAKKTSRKIMKPLFWCGFLALSILILNEEFEIYHLPEFATYIAASNLAFLHIYNLKYCKCDDEECCAGKNKI